MKQMQVINYGIYQLWNISTMEYRRIITTLLIVITSFCTIKAIAQSTKDKITMPLHIEASLDAGTPYNNIMPIDVNIDLNCTFAMKYSFHVITQSTYFLPKDGMAANYNRATNLGGGFGYVFLPQKNDQLGDFEICAFVTTSVGSSDFKNTSYNAGIHWYGHSEKHRIVPMVRIDYNFKNFSNKNLSNYNGAYFSLGLRF